MSGEQFNVSFVDSMIKMASDVWTPEWVKLVLRNRVVVKCSFKGGMDCKPEGKIFFVLKPLQNKKAQKNLRYLAKKQSFFLRKGLLFCRVPQILLALL